MSDQILKESTERLAVAMSLEEALHEHIDERGFAAMQWSTVLLGVRVNFEVNFNEYEEVDIGAGLNFDGNWLATEKIGPFFTDDDFSGLLKAVCSNPVFIAEREKLSIAEATPLAAKKADGQRL